MRLLQYLQEDYIGRVKNHYDIEVFVNPTSKEIIQAQSKSGLFPGVRFIADKSTKKIFVAESTFYHADFFKYLSWHELIKAKGSWQTNRSTGAWLMGAGIVVNGKIKIEQTSYDFALPKNILKDYDWTSKYFTNFELLFSKDEEE